MQEQKNSNFYFSKNTELKSHEKIITTIQIDKYNQRMITGSIDHTIKFWDFQSMDKTLTPFRSINPFEQQIINSLSYDKNSQKILATSTSCQPKILTKDGKELLTFLAGDMYLRDSLYSKGHTCSVTDSKFDQQNDNICYTCSYDGTIRIWDLNTRLFGIERQLPSKATAICKDKNGKKIQIEKLLINKNKLLIGFCNDGSIQCFDQRNSFKRPILIQRDNQRQFHATIFNIDPVQFFTRDNDDTIRLQDLRKFNNYIWKIDLQKNEQGNPGLAYLEKQQKLITGICQQNNSSLIQINLQDQSVENNFQLQSKKLGPFLYNKNMNQLFVAQDQNCQVYYTENNSYNGIINCLNKDVKQKQFITSNTQQVIYTPNALPMFRNDNKNKRKRFDKVRQDDQLTKRPEQMLLVPGYGGYISGPRTTAQYVMQSLHKITGQKVDPIQRAKKISKQIKPQGQYVNKAYQYTQPKPILDYSYNDNLENRIVSMFKKCKHCGLKVCQCQNYKQTK